MASVYLMQAGQDLDASPKRMIITGMKRLVPLSSLAALFCVFAALCSVSRAEAAAIGGAGGFKSPQAYEKVVNRLLGSVDYAERMAGIWLDIRSVFIVTGFVYTLGHVAYDVLGAFPA